MYTVLYKQPRHRGKETLRFYYSETWQTTPAAKESIPRGLVEIGFGGQTSQTTATSCGDQIERRFQKRQDVESHLEAVDDLGFNLRESG